MKEIEAYMSVDGTIFKDENKAMEHDLDCIGEEFDALLNKAVEATNGNVTRHDQYTMCLYLINNRKDLKKIIATLNKYLSIE